MKKNRSRIELELNSDGEMQIFYKNTDRKIPLQRKIKDNGNTVDIFVITDMHDKLGVASNPLADGAFYAWATRARVFYQATEKIQHFAQKCNNENSDIALCLGDIYDTPYNVASASQIEFANSWNSITKDKYLINGNHDSYSTLATMHGSQNNNIINAGSVFNFSIYKTKGDVSVKIIFIDNFLKDDGIGGVVRHTSYIGTLSTPTKNFIIQEIENSTTKNIVIASHCGMYLNNNADFELADITWFNNLLSTYKTNDSTYNFLHIFGHHHSLKPKVMENNNYCKMLLCSSTIEYINEFPESLRKSWFTKISISNSGVKFGYGDLDYTGLLHTEI